MTLGACATIRPGAIRHNFQVIRSMAAGCRTLAVIKGNAYGHGMLAAAGALADADAFGVARLSEARTIRQAGIGKPLLILGGVLTTEELMLAIELRAAVVVHSEHQIRLLEAAAGAGISAWLKIDTGMNRLGIYVDEAADAIDRLRACSVVDDLKIMTHFANADVPSDKSSRVQLDKFRRIADGFPGGISIANSAILFGDPGLSGAFSSACESGRLWIRPGIALYGVSPIQGKIATELGLQPAMQFSTRLLAVKRLKAREPVGYGGTWHSARDTTLGIVACGYGDGYSRFIRGGTPMLINDRRVPVVGAISMDLTAVDLGPTSKDQAGDPVLLWGDGLPVESVAEFAGTLPYQLVTGVMHREPPIIGTVPVPGTVPVTPGPTPLR